MLWRGLAEISEKYLHKGDKVYIEGRMRTRSWDDKDNVKRYTTEVIADNMTMLTVRREGEEPSPGIQEDPASASVPTNDNPSDDLPF